MRYGSASLGSVAEFINGAAFSPADWGDEGRPIIRIQNLTDPQKPFNRTRREVSPRLTVQPGDLLVSWSATLGVFTWDGDEEALLNQHIFRVLPRADLVNKSYLRHMLSRALDSMASHLHGATMQHVNRAAFLGTEIPLPPLPEQRRIASILDSAEVLRAHQRTALLNLDLLSETEVERAVNLETAGVVELRDLLTAIDSGVSPVCADRPPVDDEWGVLKLGSISSGRYLPYGNAKALLPGTQPDLRNVVKPGDILLSRKNTLELVGASVYVRDTPDRLLLPDLIFRLVLSDSAQYSPRVLQRLLSTKALRERLRGMAGGSAASMSNISKSRLLDMKVPRLSMDVQARLERLLDAIENLRTASTVNLAKLEELFASLQHRAFRGEL